MAKLTGNSNLILQQYITSVCWWCADIISHAWLKSVTLDSNQIKTDSSLCSSISVEQNITVRVLIIHNHNSTAEFSLQKRERQNLNASEDQFFFTLLLKLTIDMMHLCTLVTLST